MVIAAIVSLEIKVFMWADLGSEKPASFSFIKSETSALKGILRSLNNSSNLCR
jgi:hypothetical protein